METQATNLATRPNPILTWLFNPFHYVAGGKALGIGVALIVITGLIGALSNTHVDGVLDLHTGMPAPLWLFLSEGIVNWLVMGALLLIAGMALSSSQVRPIDVFGTQALARWPMLIAVMGALLPGAQRIGARLEAYLKDPGIGVGGAPADWAMFAVMAVVGVVMIVWMAVLMYRAFAVSSNLRGAKAIVSFIVVLIIGEILSKAAIIGLILLTPGGPAAMGMK